MPNGCCHRRGNRMNQLHKQLLFPQPRGCFDQNDPRPQHYEGGGPKHLELLFFMEWLGYYYYCLLVDNYMTWWCSCTNGGSYGGIGACWSTDGTICSMWTVPHQSSPARTHGGTQPGRGKCLAYTNGCTTSQRHNANQKGVNLMTPITIICHPCLIVFLEKQIFSPSRFL